MLTGGGAHVLLQKISSPVQGNYFMKVIYLVVYIKGKMSFAHSMLKEEICDHFQTQSLVYPELRCLHRSKIVNKLWQN